MTDVGLWRDDKHRYFMNYADTGPIGPVPGVTGVIGVLDKPAIAFWRGTTVAGIIADRLGLFTEMMTTGGRDSAVKWASGLPDYERDKAADIGSRVHLLADQVQRGAAPDMTADERLYVDADIRAHREMGIVPISMEKMVGNLTAGWGGTFDEIATVAAMGGRVVMIDRKTWRKRPEPGRDMYAETAMQLAAYSHGEFIGLENDPKRHRMPAIGGHAVLHLRPDLYEKGYALIPIHVTDADYAGFLGLLAAYRWKQSRARVVIGESIQVKELLTA